jgi:ABC-type branched-subunit amino acid transport system ATPase component
VISTLPATDWALRTVGASRSFGGVVAVNSVDLAVARGEITGIIGPNGAGKTTLLNLIAGHDRCTAGRIFIGDREITGLPAHRIAELGLMRTFQRPGVLPSLSTIENVLVGTVDGVHDTTARALAGPGSWSRIERGAVELAWEALDALGLAHVANVPAAKLSGGQKRLVELARAVLMKPEVLLLDEPMAGVHPALVAVMLTRIKALSADGMTIVLIEHDLAVVEELCHTVVFMARGEIVAQGSIAEVLRHPVVQAAAHGY